MLSRVAIGIVALVSGWMLAGTAHAQAALLDEVNTVSGGAAPIEKSFGISQAGSYQLVLTDLKLPIALASAKLAVTSGTTVLGKTSVTASAATATLTFDAPVGPLVVRIVGKAAPGASLGTVGVKITKPPATDSIQEFVASIEAPAPAIPENQAQLDEDVTAATTGTYEVSLTDLNLPQALTNLELGITEEGGGQLLILPAAGTGTFTAQAGHRYNVLALAEADAAVTAGLFNVRIRDVSTGTVVLNRTVKLGRVEQLGNVVLSAAPYILTLTDFQFPTALTQRGVALVNDGQLVARTTTTGETPFTATAGEHAVYIVATAAASSAGSLAVEVRPPGGAALFTAAKTVGGAPGTTPAYTFIADIPNAGSYRVRLADFVFPTRLTAAQLAVVQGGNTLGTLSAPGSVDVTAAAGRLFVVLLAEASAPGGGLLGVDVAPTSGGGTVFETTQGIGNLFQSRKVSATGAATYRVALTDVGFPAPFLELRMAVTRAATPVVTLLGNSQFDFDATAGNYFVNFIATPDPTENAGTYGIRVAAKPPNPTITLTAAPGEVTVGNRTTLTWTATDATSCLASSSPADAWSGSREVNGTFQSAAINSATTFSLQCTGDGGSSTKSVTVNTVAERSGGGGGRLDASLLFGLGLCFALAWRQRRQAS